MDLETIGYLEGVDRSTVYDFIHSELYFLNVSRRSDFIIDQKLMALLGLSKTVEILEKNGISNPSISFSESIWGHIELSSGHKLRFPKERTKNIAEEELNNILARSNSNPNPKQRTIILHCQKTSKIVGVCNTRLDDKQLKVYIDGYNVGNREEPLINWLEARDIIKKVNFDIICMYIN